MEYWLGKASIVRMLLFREYGRIAVFEVNLPAKSLRRSSLRSRRTSAPRTPEYEGVHQSSVAAGLDRCLSILSDVIDFGARLLVDEAGELLAILGKPGLLVSVLVIALIGNGFGRVAPLGDVLREMTFANRPQNAEMYA